MGQRVGHGVVVVAVDGDQSFHQFLHDGIGGGEFLKVIVGFEGDHGFLQAKKSPPVFAVGVVGVNGFARLGGGCRCQYMRVVRITAAPTRRGWKLSGKSTVPAALRSTRLGLT